MLSNKATQNYINQITKSQSQELQGKEDSPPEYHNKNEFEYEDMA